MSQKLKVVPHTISVLPNGDVVIKPVVKKSEISWWTVCVSGLIFIAPYFVCYLGLVN